ncbi:MAG TPA: zf-HC2 domain-containing protein [Ktedonobacterales bacterium]
MSDDFRQPPNNGARSVTLFCPDHVPPEALSAWRDGLLPAREATYLDRHAPSCPACSERLHDYDTTSSGLNTQFIPRPGSDLWPPVRDAIDRESRGSTRRLHIPRGLALGSAGAAVAALALIALFAGLFFSRHIGRPTLAATPITTTVPTATTTPAPTEAPKGPGVWTTLTGCPATTPASFRVLYNANTQQQKGGPTIVTFERSDDCGSTWTKLTPPPISGVDYTTNVDWMVAFSDPVNPQIAYLSVLASGATGCATSAATGAQVALSSMPCLVQFVTTNSGATWAHLSLPVKGALAITSPTNSTAIEGALRPQGSLLYGVVTNTVPGMSGLVPPGRLVVSSDGVHWSSVDGALAGQGLGIWDFAVPPTGSTIYVTAQPFNDPNDQPPTYAPTLSMWASANGGKTWTESAHGPDGSYGQGGSITGMVAGLSGSQSILYITVGQKNQTQLLASVDGGRNWTIDTQYPISATFQMLGTLPDGSVVLESTDASQPTLAWSPGAAQRQIAAGAGLQSISHPVFQQANGGEYLWLTGTVNANTGATATMYTKLKF